LGKETTSRSNFLGIFFVVGVFQGNQVDEIGRMLGGWVKQVKS
jgi:hypothetical protein